MITINEIQVVPTKFPDKTTQVWKLLPEQLKCQEVVWVYEGDHELVPIIQIGALLGKVLKNEIITLRCEQFPYARQDKEVSNETTFGLHPFLNTLCIFYEKIITLDVHNPAPFEWYVELENKMPNEVVQKIVEEEAIDLIVFPDKGAAKRYKHLSKIESVDADKVRDQSTGAIIAVTMPQIPEGKTILVWDDLCDGGWTFTELAKELNIYNPAKLILFVSHGIFSKGTQCLYDAGFTRIYTKEGIVE